MIVLPWLRRGLGPWLFVPMTAFLVWTSLTSHPWQLEFDWGARTLSSAIFIFAPVVAAATAYDVARRARPLFLELSMGSRRGVVAPLVPAIAVLTWSLAACCIGWLAVLLVVFSSDGVGPHDRWVFMETITALVACAVVGVVVAVVLEGTLAAGVAAGVAILLATLTSGHGANLFQVASSSGSLIGIERTPDRAVATVLCHVVLSSAAVVGLAGVFRAVRNRRRWTVFTTLAATTVVLASMYWPFAESEYQPTSEAVVCTGSGVVVCGPASARPLLQNSAGDLSDARQKLAGSGLTLPERFYVLRGQAADDVPATATLLDLDSSSLVRGHLSTGAVAATLSMPRVCAAFYSDTGAPALLARVSVVSSWLQPHLAPGMKVGAAPPEVQTAFESLATCETR